MVVLKTFVDTVCGIPEQLGNGKQEHRHELQRLGDWRTGAMVERYAHLAPDHLLVAASGLDSVLAIAAT
jgi:hypothetical protein